MNRPEIISILKNAPSFLEDLLGEIPEDLLKIKRWPSKWSIHENACHLAEMHTMMIERFKIFKTEYNPIIRPHNLDSAETPDTYLMDLDLDTCISRFRKDRKAMINILRTFMTDDWTNEGRHPEYIKYNAEIFLRHIMLHDQLHMYRIEELWLTKDEFL
jgi:hypothetical protein